MNKITKKEIREKVGKKWFLSDQNILAAKLNYISGIEYFDNLLEDKTLDDINAVIHFEKFPKGYVFKIAKFFKSYTYPLSNKELNKVILSESPFYSKLIFKHNDIKEIVFEIKEGYLIEVKNFLTEINLPYKIIKSKIEYNKFDYLIKSKNLPLLVINELKNIESKKQVEFIEEYKRKCKSNTIAYILWFIIGWHYAYLNKWGLFILFILSGGGLGIWWFIDLFRIPMLVRNYNKDIAIEVMKNLKVISN